MRTSARRQPGTSIAYVERVNLAIDHIVAHLDRPIRLKALAKVAMLSPHHFHRVFQAMTGETPADFAKRLRLDRALGMMAREPRPTLTAIAHACGFASPSDFSRSFKQRFGASPRAFDLDAWQAAHRGELERLVADATRPARVRALPSRSNPDAFKVRIRELPAREVAYIRVVKPYAGDGVIGAVNRLMGWADLHGHGENQWLGYQYDNPEITPLAQCRYYVGVEAPGVRARGEIGRVRFPAMRVAEVEMSGGIDLELRLLQWLFGTWLPRSGYVPDDQPAFEAWNGRPFAHGMEHFELRAQLPVRES